MTKRICCHTRHAQRFRRLHLRAAHGDEACPHDLSQIGAGIEREADQRTGEAVPENADIPQTVEQKIDLDQRRRVGEEDDVGL